MSVVARFRRSSVLMVAACGLYSATVWTQTRPAPTTPPPDHDRMEAAHEGLASGEDKARDAARLTTAVARPADPSKAGAPVPRRSFIDEILFARMAKDGVAHAPLSSDDILEGILDLYLHAVQAVPAPVTRT